MGPDAPFVESRSRRAPPVSSSPQPVPDSEWTVPSDGGFGVDDAPTGPPKGASGEVAALEAEGD